MTVASGGWSLQFTLCSYTTRWDSTYVFCGCCVTEEVEFDYTGLSPGGAPWRVDDGTRIAPYCQAWPDVFAGQWIENESSRVVAFTESVEEHLEAIRRLVYASEKVRAVQFRYSYLHLLDLTHQIVEIVGTSDGLTSWGPSVMSNCVVVDVLPERIDEVRRILLETNPDDVRVEPGSPVIAL